MCMLTRRTQILFDEDTYQILAELARKQKFSKGELVRRAVRKVYKKWGRIKKLDQKARAFNEIIKIRQKIRKKYGLLGIPLKDLIREGRRFDENSDY